MIARTISLVAAWLVVGLCFGTSSAAGASIDTPFGTIVGVVSSSAGVVQMGAKVFLYNRQERLVRRAITNDQGAFGFDSLPPDTYTIRVTLASFMPALRQNITVQPGMRSFLSINLASVLSSIELVYNAGGQGAIMGDDWKWVLRGSMSTRPVLRALPGVSEERRGSTSLFSNTRGLFRISAGDGVSSYGELSQQDLGTAFAVATMLGGSHQLQFSGNVGLANSGGLPSAGFHTRLSRLSGDGIGPSMSPALNLTLRQVYLPTRASATLFGGRGENAPAVRTMTMSFMDRSKVTDELEVLYGSALESVIFLDRLNYLSPFAKATYELKDGSNLQFAFSSGRPPVELYQTVFTADSELQQDLALLSLFPRLSMSGGDPRIQREENFELGYSFSESSRSYEFSAYHSRTTNAAVSAIGNASLMGAMEALPDLFARTSVLNVGEFSGYSAMASVTQNAGEHVSLTLQYGNSAVLKAPAEQLVEGPDSLRAIVRTSRQNWGAARISLTSPWTGTRLVTSYQLTGSRLLNPSHRLLTQRHSPETGLNVQVRQPIPSFGLFSGRLEATAEMRNLLAQGYLPLSAADGRKLFLIQSPRALRGGLSFIF
jgi:hypothetical protein